MKGSKYLVMAAMILSVSILFTGVHGREEEKVEPDRTGHDHTLPIPNRHIKHMTGSGEAGAIIDPNSPEAVLAEAWREFEMASSSEGRQLDGLDTAKRLRLARAAKRQSDAEFKLLRLVAEQEGAMKTVAVIDKMMAVRNQKLESALDEAKEARREEMIKEREERRKAIEERRKSRREQMAP
jgi:hypothetical protein